MNNSILIGLFVRMTLNLSRLLLLNCWFDIKLHGKMSAFNSAVILSDFSRLDFVSF